MVQSVLSSMGKDAFDVLGGFYIYPWLVQGDSSHMHSGPELFFLKFAMAVLSYHEL